MVKKNFVPRQGTLSIHIFPPIHTLNHTKLCSFLGYE